MATATLAAHQAALYAAEAETLGGLGIRWRRRSEAQAYLDALVDSAWFFERWPGFVRGTIERRASGSRWSTCEHLDAGPGSTASEGVILVADGCLTQPVVLHELAHLLLPPGTGHGPPFAETLLRLVRHEMGFVAYADFARALRRTGHFAAVGAGAVD